MPYVLEKVRAIERTSSLGFDSYLFAMFDYLPRPELLNPTPVQLIPTRLVPCRTDLSCFLCCKIRRFFTIFQYFIGPNLRVDCQQFS